MEDIKKKQDQAWNELSEPERIMMRRLFNAHQGYVGWYKETYGEHNLNSEDIV